MGGGVTVYEWWGAVPAALASRTQLSAADLPRKPGGPVRGRVWQRDWRGKDEELVDLYAVAESVPTATTARTIRAGLEREGAAGEVRGCQDCGARVQRPLRVRDGRYRCPACAKIAQLVDRQVELREQRAVLRAWAAGLLADPGVVAVLDVDLTLGEPTASGRTGRPVAARVRAVDGAGEKLVDVLVALTGPRSRGKAPEKALDPGKGAARLSRALAGRQVLCWDGGEALAKAASALERLGHPVPVRLVRLPEVEQFVRSPLPELVARWRGELDPATGNLATAWPPGAADRLHLLLAWMAADWGEGRPGTSSARRQAGTSWHGTRWGSYPVQIAVTAPPGAAERIADVLAAAGLLEGRAAVHGPVPSREVPGKQLTYLGGGKALVPGPAAEVTR